jgi:hypothetical protein
MERTASDQLADHRSVWDRKPVLRLVYDDFYDRIAAACRGGLTIEIGGGIGNLKRRLTELVATDIQSAPWLDCVADAHRLPFADACAANIVMVDVLHHLEFPVVFFREAALLKAYGYRICCTLDLAQQIEAGNRGRAAIPRCSRQGNGGSRRFTGAFLHPLASVGIFGAVLSGSMRGSWPMFCSILN